MRLVADEIARGVAVVFVLAIGWAAIMLALVEYMGVPIPRMAEKTMPGFALASVAGFTYVALRTAPRRWAHAMTVALICWGVCVLGLVIFGGIRAAGIEQVIGGLFALVAMAAVGCVLSYPLQALIRLKDPSAGARAVSPAPPAQHFDKNSASEHVFSWVRMPISSRAILTGMAIGALLTILFPPHHFRPEPGVSIWCGHSLVFSGAPNTGQRECTEYATIDFGTLCLYWAAILLLGGLVWLWRGAGRH